MNKKLSKLIGTVQSFVVFTLLLCVILPIALPIICYVIYIIALYEINFKEEDEGFMLKKYNEFMKGKKNDNE